MRQTLYRYNAETCQYERVRVKGPDVVFYASGVIVAALLMLAGMLVLHDFLFDSEKEVTLRKQNKAFEKNHVLLTAQLNAIESTLTELGEEDKKLHAKFFGSPMENRATQAVADGNKHLLLADPALFRKTVEKISDRSTDLLTTSGSTSAFFGEKLSLKDRKNMLTSIPLLQPTRPWQADNLISGFGMRVNPFHKGLYEHPGVDIAMPRGSEVVATAGGIVVEINRSTVQAGYGNYIDIDHGHGFVTRYAHLDEVLVKYRQKVTKGDVVATVGSSGGSIAPHLHYEVIRNGATVDPVPYMIEGLSSDEHYRMKLTGEKQNQSLD
ncbi:M23 family metallopeptidase [Fulvivirgaceae bacterium PWU4]|uniref:M23 family metallopeptidase n=1 Tax=Chryseosolibacter histidini TaxID=2782349 RepID=A0AAP2DM46_9BACT|nr:M23 family metallopeptidase [Chryseosolibacter histidini]MBT1697798.1 M23 family metallopeptidase [Chryseosolibacter histidini]